VPCQDLAFESLIKTSTSASNGGPRAGFSSAFFKLLASDHDDEYTMIDASMSARTNMAPGAQKKTASKPSVDHVADNTL
jgi:hypothetical protein